MQKVLHVLSVEQYHRLGELCIIPDKTEQIRGILIDKIPKSPLHSGRVVFLAELLRSCLGPDWRIRTEQPLTFFDSEPEPDLAVVYDPERDPETNHPSTAALVIEVCVTSVVLDRKKLSLYAEAQVGEVWLVLPEQRAVEVWSQPDGDRYASTQRFSLGQVLTSQVVSGLRLSTDGLFERMA